MKFIELSSNDVDACRALYREAVLNVDDMVYPPDQKTEWAGFSESPDFEAFLLDGYSIGICADEAIVGFSSSTETGHIKSLYVAPQWQGQGLAARMLEQVIARFDASTALTVDASKASRPVFKKFGFVVMQEEVVERNGVHIARYKMQRLKQDERSSRSLGEG